MAEKIYDPLQEEFLIKRIKLLGFTQEHLSRLEDKGLRKGKFVICPSIKQGFEVCTGHDSFLVVMDGQEEIGLEFNGDYQWSNILETVQREPQWFENLLGLRIVPKPPDYIEADYIKPAPTSYPLATDPDNSDRDSGRAFLFIVDVESDLPWRQWLGIALSPSEEEEETLKSIADLNEYSVDDLVTMTGIPQSAVIRFLADSIH